MSKINSSQVNHVYFLVDQSGSMWNHKRQVLAVTNSLLSEISTLIPNVENRVSVYTFNDRPSRKLIDGDPKFAVFDDYTPSGSTAINDGLKMVLEDINAIRSRTDSRDRTFLVYIITDGEDVCSRVSPIELSNILSRCQQVTTLAAFVPNHVGERYVKTQLGVPSGNISIWDVTQDYSQIKSTITSSMQTYSTVRASGATSSSNLFRPNVAAVKEAVAVGALEEFATPFATFDVVNETDIATFVAGVTGKAYYVGTAFYQLTKAEQLGPKKKVLIQNKNSSKVYEGAMARRVLGLPDGTTKISVNKTNDEWVIYVQSTSYTRKLVPGTKVIVVKT